MSVNFNLDLTNFEEEEIYLKTDNLKKEIEEIWQKINDLKEDEEINEEKTKYLKRQLASKIYNTNLLIEEIEIKFEEFKKSF